MPLIIRNQTKTLGKTFLTLEKKKTSKWNKKKYFPTQFFNSVVFSSISFAKPPFIDGYWLSFEIFIISINDSPCDLFTFTFNDWRAMGVDYETDIMRININ